MKIVISLIYLLALTSFIQAQEVTHDWAQTYRSETFNEAQDIITTKDGGYIIVGFSEEIKYAESLYWDPLDISCSDPQYTYQSQGKNFYIIKIDADGQLIWEETFGGSNSEIAYAITDTDDGGYIIIGDTDSEDGQVENIQGKTDIWAIKINEDGELLWSKTFGGFNYDRATSIAKTQDKNFVIGGYSNTTYITANTGVSMDFWVLKINTNGEIIWQKSMGTIQDDITKSIYPTADGGCVVAGMTQDQVYMVKMQEDGDILWEKTFDGNRNNVAKILQTNAGGFLLAGHSTPTNSTGSLSYWVIKTDENAEIIWEKRFGGSKTDIATTIIENPDNEIFIAGLSYSSDIQVSESFGYTDYWIVKLNPEGQIIWEKSYGYDVSFENPKAMKPTFDGGLIIAGTTTMSNNSYSGCWVVKINDGSFPIIELPQSIESPISEATSIYPNPNTGTFTIETNDTSTKNIQIYNNLGQLIQEKPFNEADTQIDLSNIPKGIYFLSIQTDQQTFTKKIIIR